MSTPRRRTWTGAWNGTQGLERRGQNLKRCYWTMRTGIISRIIGQGQVSGQARRQNWPNSAKLTKPESFVRSTAKVVFAARYYENFGTPERIRTSDLLLRRELAGKRK